MKNSKLLVTLAVFLLIGVVLRPTEN